ncbi:MAG: isopenicillin N-epimerase [Deltaproteobacteria bacterium]|nr:isopenicillin N-epimerase [Deltaproteobacteria bacterium]
MDLTAPASTLDQWSLDPAMVHLNHGSFGGCPRAVTAAANAARIRLEAAPMRFLWLEWEAALAVVRTALATFVRAPAERLVFFPNGTTAIANALASVELGAGDEILTTDQAYPSCANQLARLAAARGARLVTVPVAMPYDPDALVDAIAGAVTPRTRVALLDHIASFSAILFPLERIVPALMAQGIAVLVDGAHAPGQIDLDIAALGATWYAGTSHKWLCAPKGSAFLVATPSMRPMVTAIVPPPDDPANRLHQEFDWWGTHDPSAHLAVPTAIETVGKLGGGWPAVYAHNHALALELRRRVIDGLGGGSRHLLAPDSALGAMAAIPITLPPGTTPVELQNRLLVDDLEVVIVEHHGTGLLRVSAQLYNHAGEADVLVRKIHALGIKLHA